MYARKEIPHGQKNLLNIGERSVIMAHRHVNCEATKQMRDKFIYINLKLFSDAELEPGETDTLLKRHTRTSAQAETQIFNDGEEAVEIVTEPRIYTPHDLKELLDTYPADYQQLFREYMKYVDMVLGEEIAAAIHTSTNFIKKEISSRSEENAAVFEIVMELQEPNIAYFPSIDIGHKLSLFAKVNEIISDIYMAMKWIPKLVSTASHSDDLDYDGKFGMKLMFRCI